MQANLEAVVPLTITAKDLTAWEGYLEPHDLHAIARQMWHDLSYGRTSGKKSVLYPPPEQLRNSPHYSAVLGRLVGERLAWKLSALAAVGPKYAAIKIVGANALNRHLGLDRSQSTIMLFEKFSMRPLCLMAGSQISAARTGTYASIVAETFFQASERFTVFVFGAGPIAKWVCLQLAAIKGRSIEQLFVRAHSFTSAQRLAKSLTHLPFPITPVGDTDALGTAKLVVTATNAKSPVFAQGAINEQAVVLHLGGDETPAGYIKDMRERGMIACDDIEMVSERATSSLAQFCAEGHGSLQMVAERWGVKGLADLIEDKSLADRPAHITCVGLPSLDLYVAQHVYEAFVSRCETTAQCDG